MAKRSDDMKVAVALSGGVDSSLAAALLLEEGYEVVGVTMSVVHPPAEDPDVVRAAAVADHFDIPHLTFDLRERFRRRIIEYFAREYAAGRTPNPCVVCNPEIKFGALWDRLRGIDARAMATGHYVRKDYSPEDDWHYLRRALDASKDQSYVLHGMSQRQLSRALFPLGTWRKEEVRDLAARLRIPSAKRSESQEICFISGDYRDFIASHYPEAISPGPMVDLEGRVVGEHRGLPFYTVGQRRGLGIALGEPTYVLRLLPEQNAILLGPREYLYSRGAMVGRVNWTVPRDRLEEGELMDVAVRYNARAVPATVEVLPDGASVRFEEPVAAVTPGQSAVFYRDGLVVGGGVIEATTVDPR
ncbi:MAG: tRNA 2-thiouridine(34) synthase MnmA [Bacillota bacterium]